MESMQVLELHLCAVVFICTECDALLCCPTDFWQFMLIDVVIK